MYIDRLSEVFSTVIAGEQMCLHTSFKTGGPADVYVKADGIENIKYALNIL